MFLVYYENDVKILKVIGTVNSDKKHQMIEF